MKKNASPEKVCRDNVWQDAYVVQGYLEGVRGGIPLAEEQLDVLVRLIRSAVTQPLHVVDLGCGDGVLGRAIQMAVPDAEVAFLDFNSSMIEAARQKSETYASSSRFIVCDYGKPAWVKCLDGFPQPNVVVSGFSIHHQPDERKHSLYREIHDLLSPGGVFLNLEHVSSAGSWGHDVHDDYFIDSLWAYHRRSGGAKTRDQFAKEFYYRADKDANILAPTEDQCGWLREIGFEQVDCFIKIFELALFGGIKSRVGPE